MSKSMQKVGKIIESRPSSNKNEKLGEVGEKKS